jgi:RNA recognition motif-containing protein
MASSRVFIKGLPPTLSEDEFKKHFGAKHEITDAKLISQRRIGYVGYKTPEDAAKAVKYFNRSFIRMSKMSVEIARPVSILMYFILTQTDGPRYLMRLYRSRENCNESRNVKASRQDERHRMIHPSSLMLVRSENEAMWTRRIRS